MGVAQLQVNGESEQHLRLVRWPAALEPLRVRARMLPCHGHRRLLRYGFRLHRRQFERLRDLLPLRR